MRNFFKKKQPPTTTKKKAKTKNVNLNIPGTMSPTIITLYDRLILFPLYYQARRIVFFFFKLRPHLSENIDTPPPKKTPFVNPYLSVGGGTIT